MQKDSNYFHVTTPEPLGYEIICMLETIHDRIPAGRMANARLIAASPDMRQASQKLYDALQRYLDVADDELPEDLVEGMNELEAAWRKADGTVPEDAHGTAA